MSLVVVTAAVAVVAVVGHVLVLALVPPLLLLQLPLHQRVLSALGGARQW